MQRRRAATLRSPEDGRCGPPSPRGLLLRPPPSPSGSSAGCSNEPVREQEAVSYTHLTLPTICSV
eukprot:7324655-Alexandrium_andersonii.AAC.1